MRQDRLTQATRPGPRRPTRLRPRSRHRAHQPSLLRPSPPPPVVSARRASSLTRARALRAPLPLASPEAQLYASTRPRNYWREVITGTTPHIVRNLTVVGRTKDGLFLLIAEGICGRNAGARAPSDTSPGARLLPTEIGRDTV